MSRKPPVRVYTTTDNLYHHRHIYCHETKKYYATFIEAAYDTGADNSNIAKVCRGRLPQTKGYHFVFEDP